MDSQHESQTDHTKAKFTRFLGKGFVSLFTIGGEEEEEYNPSPKYTLTTDENGNSIRCYKTEAKIIRVVI